MSQQQRYLAPEGSDPIHRFATWLTSHGIPLYGSRILRVKGRKSGQVRENIVNILTVDGRDYLVAPRGHTQWVRNLRAAGGGELRVGRRKVRAFRATEIVDHDAKLPVLRAYLKRFGWEVGRFFEGLDKNATDAQLLEVADGFPAFVLEYA